MPRSNYFDNRSREALRRSCSIDREIKRHKKLSKGTFKILLLGTGDSGKSTINKQMRILFSDGYSAQERCDIRNIILNNIATSFRTLLNTMEVNGLDLQNESSKTSAGDLLTVEPEKWAMLDMKIFRALKEIWKDENFQSIIACSRHIPFYDNLYYFYQSLGRIWSLSWLPNDQDILRARIKTTGIEENSFSLGHININMIDVGGQRTERKKWLHCFENVDCLLFVVAMSGYDQCLSEDHDTNQMIESLSLFNALINGEWFKLTPIILFMNKFDIFRQRLKERPLSSTFPEYNGPETDEMCAATFLASRFHESSHSPRRPIYHHFTNATDSSILKKTMESVHDVISRRNMHAALF